MGSPAQVGYWGAMEQLWNAFQLLPIPCTNPRWRNRSTKKGGSPCVPLPLRGLARAFMPWTPRTLSPARSAHPKLTRPRIQSIKNLKEPHLQGVLVPAQPEDIDMFQHQFPLLAEAAGQAGGSPAFSAGPSLAAPTAHGGEAVPTGQPLPRQGKRYRAC